jgi:hypothetical protein
MRNMRAQHIIFIIVSMLFNLFFWYYIVVFCSVYPKSAMGLLYSFGQGLIIDWCVFELIRPIGSMSIRLLVKHFVNLRYFVL